jgi:glycosyltransferase involved in cell wall biosynthesis
MGIHYLKMRIGFDLRPFLRQETGVGIYFKNLLFTLAKIDQVNEYYLFSSSLKDRFDPKDVPPFEKKDFVDRRYPVKVINFLWYRMGWPSLDVFFNTNLDLTHSPTPLPLPTRGKKIITVYDLFFLDSPDLTDKEARKVFSRRIEKSLQKADGIVTISHFTERQLVERFVFDMDKMRVIHPGINLQEWGMHDSENLKPTSDSLALPSDFLLFVGAQEPRKNLPRLLESLKLIHDRYQKIPLVLVGRKGLDSDNVQKNIQKLGLDSEVKTVGYVNKNELKHIYGLASAFVFPSLMEGFGIPLLEAMACGVPIVTSRTSALPEIAQDAAVYIDPEDPEDMATKIIHLLEDTALREKLVSAAESRVKFFSWEKTARKALQFYQSVMLR